MKICKLFMYCAGMSLIGCTWIYTVDKERREAYHKGFKDGCDHKAWAQQILDKCMNPEDKP